MLKQKVLDKIIDWAQKEEPIKVLILTGSLAGKGPKDELSDYRLLHTVVERDVVLPEACDHDVEAGEGTGVLIHVEDLDEDPGLRLGDDHCRHLPADLVV